MCAGPEWLPEYDDQQRMGSVLCPMDEFGPSESILSIRPSLAQPYMGSCQNGSWWSARYSL